MRLLPSSICPIAQPASRSPRTRRSRRLNAAYRGKPTPTNVLSFSAPASDQHNPLSRRHRACGRDGRPRGRGAGHPARRITCSTSSCTGSCIFRATIIRRPTDAEVMEALEVRILADTRDRRSLRGRRAGVVMTHRGLQTADKSDPPATAEPARRRRAGPSTQSLLSALLAPLRPALAEPARDGRGRPQGAARGRRRILAPKSARCCAGCCGSARCASMTSWCRAPTSSRWRRTTPCRSFCECSARRACRASPCSARRSTIRAA